ncbi:MAG: hypothetical protein ACLU9S_23560 [Oscillospiraceae bacterium]
MGFTGSLSLGHVPAVCLLRQPPARRAERREYGLRRKSMSLGLAAFFCGRRLQDRGVHAQRQHNTAPANCAVLSESNLQRLPAQVEIVGGFRAA